jgi:hypothetical protein
MQKIIALALCLSMAYSTIAQVKQQQYRNVWNQAYAENPGVPLGLLEAIAYAKTRMKNIDPQQITHSCSGVPPPSGVMGLIDDGKGYFKNTTGLVASKSRFTKASLGTNMSNTVLGYAAAFARIQNELNITSNSPEANVPVLRYLSEIGRAHV